MPREIICTVGTSLLTNRDDRPWSGWNPAKKDPLPDAAEVDAWLRQADLVKASAETNTLRLLELDETDTLSLLHSDTPEGRFCAERLAELYREAIREVHLEKIGQLGYAARNFSRGLKALVDVVLKRVHAAGERGRLPVFCATGGFKAEIAFMNLMARCSKSKSSTSTSSTGSSSGCPACHWPGTPSLLPSTGISSAGSMTSQGKPPRSKTG